MKILAWPAFKNKEFNPYNWLLNKELVDMGLVVEEFTFKKVIFGQYSIWHIHWPERYLSQKNICKAIVKTAALLILIKIAKLRGIKIIWTVHNLSSHENSHFNLEKAFWKYFILNLDAYISLSNSSRDLALKKFPKLHEIRDAIIFHGDYRTVYPNTIGRSEARLMLNIPYYSKVIIFIGQIRPYKNVQELVKQFRLISDSTICLLIAGLPNEKQVTDSITIASEGDPRIKLYLEFIPDEQIQLFLNASDLVVLPYEEILNSGSAILALSFNKPVLVPDLGSFGEIQSIVGDNWVFKYKGSLNPEVLKDSLFEACSENRQKLANLDALNWINIAAKTRCFYKDVINDKELCELNRKLP